MRFVFAWLRCLALAASRSGRVLQRVILLALAIGAPAVQAQTCGDGEVAGWRATSAKFANITFYGVTGQEACNGFIGYVYGSGAWTSSVFIQHRWDMGYCDLGGHPGLPSDQMNGGWSTALPTCVAAPAPPEQFTISLSGPSWTLSRPAGAPLPQVALVTGNSGPASGKPVTVTIASGGSYSGTTNAAGEVAFVYMPPAMAVTDTLTATCTGCSNTATKSVQVDACSTGKCAGNPIDPGTGEKVQAEPDWSDPGVHGLSFTRYYGSYSSAQAGLGPRWSHSYGVRLTVTALEAKIDFPAGRKPLFRRANASQPWFEDGKLDTLVASPAGPLYTRMADESRWQFDTSGRLVSITERNGWTTALAYNTQGQLERVTNAFGRSLQLAYDALGRLASVTAPGGQATGYAYDAQGRLAVVTDAGGATRTYHYEDARHPTALTGITNEAGIRYATFTYDAQGRATSTSHVGGVGMYSVTYPATGAVATLTAGASVDPASQRVTAQVTDPRGQAQSYSWTGGNGKAVLEGASGPFDGNQVASATYNSANLPESQTDFLGVQTSTTWDLSRQLPLFITAAANRPEAQTVQTQWHPTLRLPVLVTETGRTTAYSYDARGNKLTETVTDTASGQSRTWSWSYAAQGLVETMTDPRGGVWRYAHDASGNVTSIRDPLGRTTTYSYDTAGRLIEQVEPGGLTTTYSYDARGRLLSQTRGGETTTYAYTPTGNLASVTLPNGYAVSYGYDLADRLISAQDNRGASITYTLDAAGNRTREEVKDAAGNIALATSRTINALNKVAAIQGAQGQTTQIGYDANGHAISQTDPLNQTTRQTLDGLRRTTATTFPDNATAAQAWNQLDQLTQVTDPKGVATQYTTNAFGEVMSETSPDIGTIKYTRDANGEVIATEDAKGQIARIERDALGRPTRIDYAANHSVFYRYSDAGFVIAIEDKSGTTTYTRDAHGRILTKTQTVNDNPGNPSRFAVAYTHGPGGDLAGITYPSGLKVSYRRTAGQITGIDVQEPASARKNAPVIPFVANLVHTPLGQPKAWSWSTGDSASRTFDADGRMTANEFASYGYDAAGRMTSITQNLWAQRTVTTVVGTTTVTTTELYKHPVAFTAGYDSRDRLVSFARTGSEIRYTYDANSNRLTGFESQSAQLDLEASFDAANQASSAQQALNIDSASNRLLGFAQTLTRTQGGQPVSSATSNVAYTLDANGSVTSDGLRNFDYDASGRLAQVRIVRSGEAAKIQYLHNALGQRVFKSEPQAEDTLPNEDELSKGFVNWLRKNFGWMFQQGKQAQTSLGQAFVYGDGEIPAWALLGDYGNGSANGKGRTEYIWLPSEDGHAIPIGIYRNGRFYAVHADHLGTPRLITDDANKVVSQWPYGTFGANNPSGVLQATTQSDGQVVVKATKPVLENELRFPGQYRDEETGTFYNLMRDYDPQVGRYRQGDPIGLGGGLQRFGYADAAPLMLIDPLGLWTIGDPVDQRVVDAVAAFGDTISFNGTRGARSLIGMDGADTCSRAYAAGEATAVIYSLAFGGAHFGRHAANVGATKFFKDSRAYSTVQSLWSRAVGGYKGKYDLHHWYKPQSAGGTSAGWNMVAISPWLNRRMSDGGKLYSAFKAAMIGTYLSAASAVPTAIVNSRCECRR